MALRAWPDFMPHTVRELRLSPPRGGRVDLRLCQNPLQIRLLKSFVCHERETVFQPCPKSTVFETLSAISARRAARRFRSYSSRVRSAAPNARPRASSFLLQILAVHRRHVNRVLQTVPSGEEIGL